MVVVLCVSHKNLFFRHSEALVAVFLAEDWAIGRKRAAALKVIKDARAFFLWIRD